MNIILVSDNLAKSRVITLSQHQVVTVGIGFVALMLVFGSILYAVTMRYAVDLKNPYLQSLLSTLYRQEAAKNEGVLRDNLNAFAAKLGEMQARLMRLDAFGARLVKVAGLKPGEFDFSEPPGRGGALPSALPQRELSASEFTGFLNQTSRWLDDRSDKLGVLDGILMDQRLKKKALPTVMPVTVGFYSSNFGYRIDPFTGRSTLHEGIDFVAPKGTPVAAAAGGVVVGSEVHPEYGNMIEVDHGNGLTSRYAHLSRRLANVGDVVLKGQTIGEVGSTGRSTGSHLHFEVRNSQGAALNPKKFLELEG
jgi:murein DD-endopeptidase MepM/ murein hydrolase activator NlpD